MKEIIDKLVEIEDKAQKIVNNASQEKAKLSKEIREEVEQYKAQVDQENQKRLEGMKKKIADEIKPETDKIYQEANEHLSKVETNFRENQDQMAQEIFERIIEA